MRTLLTVMEVATYLRVSTATVYELCARGKLPVHRLDGWGLRYVPIEIRNWAGRTNKKHR